MDSSERTPEPFYYFKHGREFSFTSDSITEYLAAQIQSFRKACVLLATIGRRDEIPVMDEPELAEVRSAVEETDSKELDQLDELQQKFYGEYASIVSALEHTLSQWRVLNAMPPEKVVALLRRVYDYLLAAEADGVSHTETVGRLLAEIPESEELHFYSNLLHKGSAWSAYLANEIARQIRSRTRDEEVARLKAEGF